MVNTNGIADFTYLDRSFSYPVTILQTAVPVHCIGLHHIHGDPVIVQSEC